MELWKALLIAVVPSTITAITTIILSQRSQLNQNTNTINDLNKKLDADFQKIMNDIGRNDNKSLSAQHNDISQCITNSFSAIDNRYKEEDATYQKFTTKQFDLKETLENFSKEYTKLIEEQSKLHLKIESLEKDINSLKEENRQLSDSLPHKKTNLFR